MTEQPSLQDRLADAFKDADYDLPIEQCRDLADAALIALKRELAALAEYEHTINWMTTCTSCARVLDSSIRETERAERTAATIARVQNFRDKWLAYPADDVQYTAGLTLARDLSGDAWGSDEPQPTDGGPTVADCKADDRRWFAGEKAGE